MSFGKSNIRLFQLRSQNYHNLGAERKFDFLLGYFLATLSLWRAQPLGSYQAFCCKLGTIRSNYHKAMSRVVK